MSSLPSVPLGRLLEAVDAFKSDAIDEFFMSVAGDETEREQRLTAEGALGRAALWYARRGIPVFAKAPGSKTPMRNCPSCRPAHAGGQPPHDPRACDHLFCHAHDSATLDPAQIHAMWHQSPRSNIALRTGYVVDVLDIDVKYPKDPRTKVTGTENGYDSLKKLTEARDLPPVIAWAATPSGGLHLYLVSDASRTTQGIYPGVDYKGINGWIDAPPSRRNDGKRYAWIPDFPLMLPEVR